MKANKIYSLPFLALLITLFIMMFDQRLYRYKAVFNIGTHWRVMDILILTLLGMVVITYGGRFPGTKLRVPGERSVYRWLIVLALVGILAVIRGYLKVGTLAIGLGRYTLLEILLVPIVVSIVNSESRLYALLRFMFISVIVCWLYHILRTPSAVLQLLQGNAENRLMTAYTALGLANGTVLILPVLFDNRLKRKIFGHLPIKYLFYFSLSMIILVQHRSVWVATFIGILLFVFLRFKERKRVRTLVSGIFVVIMLGVFLLLLDTFFGQGKLLVHLQTRAQFVEGYQYDSTGRWRVEGWTYVIKRTMSKAPFWGFGFSETGWRRAKGEVVESWEHNQYIHLFRASGFIGLIIYLTTLIKIIQHGLRYRRQLKNLTFYSIMNGVLAANVATLSFMLFYNQTSSVWINLALLIATVRIYILRSIGHRQSISASSGSRGIRQQLLPV